MADTPRDDQWIRHGLALLEMSAGALNFDPAPPRRAVRSFVELAGGLAERCPAWLQPWPRLGIETPGDDEAPLLAVSLERRGERLLARETAPQPGHLGIGLVVDYYLHLVADHVRACRLAARRPAGVAALSAGEQAQVAEAFEEVDRVLHGAAGRDRLAALWDGLREGIHDLPGLFWSPGEARAAGVGG